MHRRLASLLAVALLVPALAGCADEAPSSTSQPLQPGSTGAPIDAGNTGSEAPKLRGTSERWHFHDYWQGSPTITLLDTNVTLNLTVRDDGTPAYEHVLAFPRGTLVPAETGHLTITLNWTSPEPGPVNLTYRPADANWFVPLADLSKGEPMQLPTTESMCDVPHRQESHWRFNLSAPATVRPDDPGAGAQAPPTQIHVVVQATIGRPLFIDPPHLDWWSGLDVISLVEGASGEFVSVKTPVERNLTLPGGGGGAGGTPQPGLAMVQDNLTVAADEGRIVPEGTKSIVVLVNWTSDVPDAKLALRYQEANSPSAGALEVVQDGAGSRVFVLPVTPKMTDTTYSNRTTWQFHVLPEGDGAAAFEGVFELHAWATRHAPADAVRLTLGG